MERMRNRREPPKADYELQYCTHSSLNCIGEDAAAVGQEYVITQRQRTVVT